MIEHIGKAILIIGGKSWDELKNYGHNVLKIYDALSVTTKLSICDQFSKPEPKYMVRDDRFSPALDWMRLFTGKETIETSGLESVNNKLRNELTKYTFARDEEGNITRMLLNIKTRYPGESISKFSESDLDFLDRFCSYLYHHLTAIYHREFKEKIDSEEYKTRHF